MGDEQAFFQAQGGSARCPSRISSSRRRTTIVGAATIVILGIALVVVQISRSREASPENATESPVSDAAAANALIPEARGVPLRVFPTGVNHVVGQERFAVGLVDENGIPVETGTVDFVFLTLRGE